ncbi:hypothetical protein DPX16_0566 [Anabarilius grahami]|uniref:Uncharacterized protein n=1 Tax=Anabarilius grahami TaxID=495550 RepID=A0A3N0ZBM8_ANAGA|nr:hypothetical protein DPX16_0566 [Anabarilius grahami]
MAEKTSEKSGSHTRPKRPQEVEDFETQRSDIDDPVEDIDYYPPQQEPSSSEEERSGDEDPTPQSTEASQGHKRLHGETYKLLFRLKHCHSSSPRCLTQQVESDGSNDDPEEPTPGTSFQGQPKQGRGVRWRAAQ